MVDIGIMTNHPERSLDMVTTTTFLCASCGTEVHMDWCAPAFGLCEACEERIQQTPVSWPVDNSMDRTKKCERYGKK